MIRALALSAVVLAIARSGSADHVVLRRGETIVGRVLEDHSGGVRIDAVVGGIRATLYFPRQEVREVVRGPLSDSFFEDSGSRGAVPQTVAPVTISNETKPQEGNNEIASLLRRAEAGDTDAMWALVRAYENGNGVPQNLPRMASWLKRLVARRDTAAQVKLAGYSPSMYAGLCRRESLGRRSLVQGEAVEVTARVKSLDQDLIILETEAAEPARVRVVTTNMRVPPLAAVGRALTIRGAVLANGSLLGLDGDVPSPAYEYRYALEQHMVIGGDVQEWVVKVTVTNTGTQPIRSAELTVRCYQIQSPNKDNPPRRIEIRDLNPGEARTVDVEFTLYNFLYLGASSMPRVEVAKGKLAW